MMLNCWGHDHPEPPGGCRWGLAGRSTKGPGPLDPQREGFRGWATPSSPTSTPKACRTMASLAIFFKGFGLLGSRYSYVDLDDGKEHGHYYLGFRVPLK